MVSLLQGRSRVDRTRVINTTTPEAEGERCGSDTIPFPFGATDKPNAHLWYYEANPKDSEKLHMLDGQTTIPLEWYSYREMNPKLQAWVRPDFVVVTVPSSRFTLRKLQCSRSPVSVKSIAHIEILF